MQLSQSKAANDRRRSEKKPRRLSKQVFLRFTEEERAAIENARIRHDPDTPLSIYLRHILLREVQRASS